MASELLSASELREECDTLIERLAASGNRFPAIYVAAASRHFSAPAPLKVFLETATPATLADVRRELGMAEGNVLAAERRAGDQTQRETDARRAAEPLNDEERDAALAPLLEPGRRAAEREATAMSAAQGDRLIGLLERVIAALDRR